MPCDPAAAMIESSGSASMVRPPDSENTKDTRRGRRWEKSPIPAPGPPYVGRSFENVQRGDDATFDVLRHLARRAQQVFAVLVISCRDDETGRNARQRESRPADDTSQLVVIGHSRSAPKLDAEVRAPMR
ncbi:hypothetical protein Acsp06_51340 [Actinomycetospora sp. NBRC 106375]|uniref:hypothetical protein n=1 Tax=Actinomycetospora sp. NBRC 106375 TaxID=3032207 RepID=UPI0024A217AB|nr:hypothetical protein [Actinomycetospora sp. NBRC 106375]GLZ48949.1 hypothetical protein Acsp06_51340 [Actinomycetospora sp. NBRC 106375]